MKKSARIIIVVLLIVIVVISYFKHRGDPQNLSAARNRDYSQQVVSVLEGFSENAPAAFDAEGDIYYFS